MDELFIICRAPGERVHNLRSQPSRSLKGEITALPFSVFVVYCAFIMDVSVYQTSKSKGKIKQNETKALKITLLFFRFFFVCVVTLAIWGSRKRRFQNNHPTRSKSRQRYRTSHATWWPNNYPTQTDISPKNRICLIWWHKNVVLSGNQGSLA